MQATTSGMFDPGSAGASGLQPMTLKPWEIAVKSLLTASGGLTDVEHASDTEFQAWIEANNLQDLVDDNGIVEWSFDDRCRIINFAIRQRLPFHFADETIPSEESNNSDGGIVSELFVLRQSASEDGGDEPPDIA